jgi:hypothetical protein
MLFLSPISKSFLDTLSRSDVKYLLVGGHAAQFYGSPRSTRDLDIWVGMDLSNAERLVEALRMFRIRSAELIPALFRHPNRIVRIDFPPLVLEVLDPVIGQKPVPLLSFQAGRPESIEILTVQSGASFETAYAQRMVVILEGVEVNVINKEHFRTIKSSTDRLKDQQDVVFLK